MFPGIRSVFGLVLRGFSARIVAVHRWVVWGGGPTGWFGGRE